MPCAARFRMPCASRRSRRPVGALAALVAVLTLAGCSLLGGGGGSARFEAGTAYTFGVIGDLPYSKAQLKDLPGWIAAINAARPDFTVHVGDTKEGGDECTKGHDREIRDAFDSFDAALIFTPGDNDWADCHSKAAGRHDPLERLAELRSIFYPVPGRTLGKRPLAVTAADGFPENVTFAQGGVRFAVVHLVGSRDGLEPWSDLGEKAVTPAQDRAERERVASDVAVLGAAFAQARAAGDRAVVVLTQANLFRDEAPTDRLRPVVEALVAGATGFAGQVVLVNGDTHEMVLGDHPLASGSRWLTAYGVSGSADGLTQVVVPGDKVAGQGWMEFAVHEAGAGAPVTWRLLPY